MGTNLEPQYGSDLQLTGTLGERRGSTKPQGLRSPEPGQLATPQHFRAPVNAGMVKGSADAMLLYDPADALLKRTCI